MSPARMAGRSLCLFLTRVPGHDGKGHAARIPLVQRTCASYGSRLVRRDWDRDI